MKEIVCLSAVAVVWVLMWLMAHSTPTVRMTWPDRECIEVVPPEAGTCAELPARHDVQWVAPR